MQPKNFETHFESLAFENLNNNLKFIFTIQLFRYKFSIWQKLGLPKGNIKILAELVYANKDKNNKKTLPNFLGINFSDI